MTEASKRLSAMERTVLGTAVVVGAVAVAQGAAFWALGNRRADEFSTYSLVGFAIPAVLVSLALSVKRRNGPAEGVRLRRIVGVALAVAVLADYFVGLTRVVPLVVASKATSLLVFGLLVRLRLSEYASPTLAAMARGALAFERLLFALVLFGVNAWVGQLEGREQGLTLVLVAFYLPILGAAETMLARRRRAGRFAGALAVAGMLWCAAAYAGGGLASYAVADSWVVGGAFGLASTALATVGIWIYSGAWR